ncbi:PREDICTED: uncharacterized protein LOC108662416 [Theobroma cacao]|uniref:Uncharacterized protein LOC108662416 n=1 Tax=Theobroma cacao TaxID=3641 RepID=A0AB32WH20_THECC|nr:PREDICTED: uncharacterized protein LOC108662416 [Theobroma cacao]
MCTVDGLQCGYRTASARVIGELISSRVQRNCVTPLRPKEIMAEMNRKWGLQCLYGKAWQAKEYAEILVFGPLEESFQLVPSYFHMLKHEIPALVVIRLIVAIDATHLKGRFKGILFVAVCKDANEQIYPLAFGIGHVEDEESWLWFKREDVAAIFTMAANCYRVIDFDRHMNQLKQLCKPTYDILMRLGLERWASARSPVRRYKLMTSNTAECINSCLRHARKMTKTVLIECIRCMFQRWLHDWHNEALNLTTPLSPWATDLLNIRFNEACHFFVLAIDRVEFQVIGGSKDRVMNLSTKECSFGEFQSDILPCTHAMAAISKCKRAAIEFYSNYYKTRSWAKGYAATIRPIGHPSEWDILDDIQQIVVLPPS